MERPFILSFWCLKKNFFPKPGPTKGAEALESRVVELRGAGPEAEGLRPAKDALRRQTGSKCAQGGGGPFKYVGVFRRWKSCTPAPGPTESCP